MIKSRFIKGRVFRRCPDCKTVGYYHPNDENCLTCSQVGMEDNTLNCIPTKDEMKTALDNYYDEPLPPNPPKMERIIIPLVLMLLLLAIVSDIVTIDCSNYQVSWNGRCPDDADICCNPMSGRRFCLPHRKYDEHDQYFNSSLTQNPEIDICAGHYSEPA